MEALILSCSTGGGHNSAGHAIESALKSRGWTVTFMDPYSLRSNKMADRVGNTYVQLVRTVPQAFGGVYEIGKLYVEAERKWNLPDPVLLAQKKTARKLKEWLDAHPVDLVICTHPFPGLMLTWLKQHHQSTPPSIMIATDYACIPFEADVKTDWMVIPHPDLIEEFVKDGVERGRILPLGIPVDPKLSIPSTKAKASKALHLDPAKRHILLGGGSMGTSGIWKIIQELLPFLKSRRDVDLLVLCGTNEEMRKKIEDLHEPSILAVPFTRRMYEYLHASSLYITKPGGLSITEAASCGVPLVFSGAIPGCETINANFFEQHGWGRVVRQEGDLLKYVQSGLTNRAPRSTEEFFRKNTDRLADWCQSAALLGTSRPLEQWKPLLKSTGR